MTPLCVAIIHAFSKPGDAPRDRVTVGRHRPHADAVLDQLHVARGRIDAGGALEHLRGDLHAPGRLRGLDHRPVEVVRAEHQAAAHVRAQVDARRVDDATERLSGT